MSCSLFNLLVFLFFYGGEGGMSKVFLLQKRSHTGENVSAAYNQFSI